MRGRWLVVCSLSAVSYVVSPSVASPASNPQVRRGFWLGFGGGLGSADATCDACIAGKRENGIVGYFNLGGTIHDRLLLGAEVNLWSKDHEGVTLNLYNILATATIYPQPSSNYFLKVGAGGGLHRHRHPSGLEDDHRRSGQRAGAARGSRLRLPGVDKSLRHGRGQLLVRQKIRKRQVPRHLEAERRRCHFGDHLPLNLSGQDDSFR